MNLNLEVRNCGNITTSSVRVTVDLGLLSPADRGDRVGKTT